MIFLVESIIACALFTLFVFLMSRDPVYFNNFLAKSVCAGL